MEKQSLLSLFSSNPDKYYKVSLFDDKGFKRQNCKFMRKILLAIKDIRSCAEGRNYSCIVDPPRQKD